MRMRMTKRVVVGVICRRKRVVGVLERYQLGLELGSLARVHGVGLGGRVGQELLEHEHSERGLLTQRLYLSLQTFHLDRDYGVGQIDGYELRPGRTAAAATGHSGVVALVRLRLEAQLFFV
jgi:hypothetical protein